MISVIVHIPISESQEKQRWMQSDFVLGVDSQKVNSMDTSLQLEGIRWSIPVQLHGKNHVVLWQTSLVKNYNSTGMVGRNCAL